MFFIGGLSVFLFGLNYMRDALIKISGQKLKHFISIAVGSKFKALLTGIVITTLIQSSSGVSAIVIALISANLITMTQGVMVMIGANIGTTTTAFLFTLQIENYSFIIIFIGYIFSCFKKPLINNIGSSITGFGLLFLGIYIMNFFYSHLSSSPSIINYFIYFSNNRFTSFLTGTLVSALIQSSSGTINLIQNLFFINIIDLKTAVSFMLGANLGTTLASLLFSVSSTRVAKNAVYINILFNLFGGIIFIIILIPFCNFLLFFQNHSSFIINNKILIAFSHLFYNVVSSIIFYFIYDLFFLKSKETFDTVISI